MEVEAAVRRYLLGDAAVTGYVVDKVWRTGLVEKVDGTGGMAVVVARAGAWATPGPMSSLEFPLVRVECWADPTRDSDGQIVALDAADKAFALSRVCRTRLLSRPRDLMMGRAGSNPGLFVVSIEPDGEAILVTKSDLHYISGMSASEMGDSVYVHADYAFTTVH